MKYFIALSALLISISIHAQKIKKDLIKPTNCDYKITKYPDGTKKEEGCFVNGIKEGLWKEYWENGIIKHTSTYINGRTEGAFSYFYSDGKIHKTGFYKNNAGTDTLTIYDEIGGLISKSVWKATGYKMCEMTWIKIYAKDAKANGVTEFIGDKYYIWQLGEKLEMK
ncbi:MAG: hypothetical protein H0W73_16445 [Bacteroidetes bacterium]|nr:hypothetical protein [Bacteroidota bacterium]